MRHAHVEVLPPPISDFRLPPGLELPENVILTEYEAARFIRESAQKLRKRRLAGTGPAFFAPPGDRYPIRYTVWDLLAWIASNRRLEMPAGERSHLRHPPSAAAS